MSNNPLQEAIARIKALQEILKEAPESWEPRTAPAKQVQRRQAEEEINTIMDGFRKMVSAQAAKIYILGEKKSKLEEARQVAAEYGAVVVDADELYKRLVAPVAPMYQQRGQVGTDMTLVLENDVMLACQTNNVTPSDFPRVPGNCIGAVFENPEEALLGVARAVVEQVCGTQLQQAMLTQLIFSETLRLEVTDMPVAIIVLGIREKEIVEFEARGFFAGRPSGSFNADRVKSIEASLKATAQKLVKALGVQPEQEAATETVTEVTPVPATPVQ